jgi:virulence-associated protein VapD
MFAIGFDLVVADAATHHPKGVSQAYGKHWSDFTRVVKGN